jgi:hypothetical protein
MRPVLAATVTLDDLKQYFKGEHWRAAVRDDGVFEGRSNSYHVELSPGGSPSFLVKVHAHEDESDADEAVTDEPMKFLVDFLKTGSAGDEALQKMSSFAISPTGMVVLLRRLANEVQTERIGPRALSCLLRRASLMPDMPHSLGLLAAAVHLAAREHVEVKEMQELAKKMKEKGWRVKPGKNDRGMPELTVDIAGVYEAKLEVDHMPWKYSFEVHEHPDTHAEGITDDPIAEFRRYYKSETVQTAKDELKAGHKEKAVKTMEEGTIPSSKKKSPEPHEPYESGSPS